MALPELRGCSLVEPLKTLRRVFRVLYGCKAPVSELETIHNPPLNKGMNELDQFAQDTKNLLDQPLNEVKETVEEPVIEVVEEEEAKNRRERRLKDKLQAEREANIAMSARLEVLAEAQKANSEAPSEYLKNIERIYGTDSPEAVAATQLLQNALTGLEEKVMQRALETMRQEQKAAQEEVAKEEKTLESFVENIEDTYKVTLSPEMQKGFFTLLEKMSPKDSSGNVIQYADPDSVWEVFSERIQKKTDTRAKDLASRGMVSGGNTGESKLQDDATRRFLQAAGIL